MITDHVLERSAPARDGETALPLGNGRLGGMLLMPPGGICFQLSHADFWRSPDLLDVPDQHDREFGGRPVSLGRIGLGTARGLYGDDDPVTMRLPLVDPKATITTAGAAGANAVSVFVTPDDDVLVLRWRRTGATADDPARITLTGWRPGITYAVDGHVALMQEEPGDIRAGHEALYLTELLGAEYRPETHAACTAVAVTGAAGVVMAAADGVVLELPAGDLDVTVIVAVALAVDGPTPTAAAREVLDRARATGVDTLAAAHTAWWRATWNRARVDLRSADGSAQRFERHWWFMTYLMAAGNRGRRPLKFNRGIWLVEPTDAREWAGGYWYYNMRDAVLAMLPADQPELAENLYRMYLDAAEVFRRQTRDCYGRGGLVVPETATHDGAMLRRDRERLYFGPTWFTGLIFSTSLEIAYHLHRYAGYRGDDALLRDEVYPFTREVISFFLQYLFKDDDGCYHIFPTNGHETWWHVRDGICDLAGLRAVLPLVIRMGETYGAEEEELADWRELLENLAPLPRGRLTMTGAIEPGVRANGLYDFGPVVTCVDVTAPVFAPCEFLRDVAMHNCHPVAIYPVYPFHLCHAGTADRQVGIDTWRTNIHPHHRQEWAADVIVPALLGLGDEAKATMTAFADANWKQAQQYFERYGKTATTVDAMLLHDFGGKLRLFPALPSDWTGRFKLLAHGPVLVEAAHDGAAVLEVTLTPRRNQTITLVNPWPGQAVSVAGDAEDLILEGDDLSWPAKDGVVYTVVPIP